MGVLRKFHPEEKVHKSCPILRLEHENQETTVPTGSLAMNNNKKQQSTTGEGKKAEREAATMSQGCRTCWKQRVEQEHWEKLFGTPGPTQSTRQWQSLTPRIWSPVVYWKINSCKKNQSQSNSWLLMQSPNTNGQTEEAHSFQNINTVYLGL